MSLFGFFDNEKKEETENKGIVCPSTGHVYRNWKHYSDETEAYIVGEQYGRKEVIVFPDFDDWLDCHAAKHVDRAIETHANVKTMWHKVDDVQKKMDILIEMNQQLLEQNRQLAERLERLEEQQHEVER